MTSDTNWGLIIASGVVVGLLILILITGLLLLSPPPASEPLGTPDGMLARSGPGTDCKAPLDLEARRMVLQAGQLSRLPAQKG